MRLLLLIALCLTIPTTYARGGGRGGEGGKNYPCSKSKGGVNHCEGTKFICNDGSTSKSKEDCDSSYIDTKPDTTDNGDAQPQAKKPKSP